MKTEKVIAALVYDFDKTLSQNNMQEYAFIPELGLAPEKFWSMCAALEQTHRMDSILAYMRTMLQEAHGKKLLTRDAFHALGRSVALFEGVSDWFARINAYGTRLGLSIEHYVISSGLQEIIEGTSIAKEFKEIYAASFCYDEKGVPIWPAMAVNYTSKTQFLFRINKGVLDINEHQSLNEFMPDEKRRVPFQNMIYLGDGMTDVPCMKLVKVNGGHSIAVYRDNPAIAKQMLCQGRVDFAAPAVYTEGGKLDQTVKIILKKIKASNAALAIHLKDCEWAKEV